jgi:inner membrane protein
LLWALRDFEHRRAVNALEARTYNGADPLRASAYPKFIDPFHWYGVVETPAFFALGSVDSLGPEVDPEDRLQIRYKPEETPVTLAAKKSYVGRVFLDWAQYPITETEALQPPEQGFIVLFQDLRYAGIPRSITGRRSRGGLSRAVQLDKSLNVVGDVYDTGKGRVVVPEPGQP